ncbi:MAG: DUF4157 domain-containing protein [Phycisphaerae bacterium]|nr:DUF4157 domain-containing protein [Phycisphaerae bacterium]
MTSLRSVTRTAMGCTVAALLASTASAQVGTVTTGPSASPIPSSMRERLGAAFEVPVFLPPNASGEVKRDALCTALGAAGFAVGCDVAFPTRTDLHGLDLLGHELAHILQQSRSPRDTVAAPGAVQGTIRFSGHFDPMGPTGLLPAVFTAGVVTDLGEISATFSAADLNFQTEGPIICQALFQRLAPRAPQIGAQILLAGDRLEVYFDPAYTYSITGGGIIIGTTSGSPGASASVLLPPPSASVFYTPSALEDSEPLPTEQFSLNFTQHGGMCPAPLFPGMNASQIPDSALAAAVACGLRAGPIAADTLVIRELALDESVTVHAGIWPIRLHRLSGPSATGGTIQFDGDYDSISRPTSNCAAGFSTDLGSALEVISADELPSPLTGQAICQALFQRLAPRAPDLGVQLLYAGDRLEIYFDPAYTVKSGGIAFGNTTMARDVAGTLHFVPRTPPPLCPADFNGDGNVDPDDLSDYIGCFFAPPDSPCPRADFNQDGNTDPDDLSDYIGVFFTPTPGC